MLTGKNKEQFEEWFNKNIHDEQERMYYIEKFYSMHLSMQFGVYVDYYNSIDVRVFIEEEYDTMFQYQRGFNPVVNGTQLHSNGDCFPHIEEARTKALEKANEIVNEKQ